MQLTELLRSFVRCRDDYPNLSQSDVSGALQLSIALDALGEPDTARAQALSYKLATVIQPIARQLDSDVHRAEAVSLWEESVKLLKMLFTRDQKRHQVAYCRALHHHSAQLYKAGCWVKATHVSQEAVRLRRLLYKADPASTCNCTGLASSLDLYSKCLRKQNRINEARPFTREALTLLRKLYETNPDRHGVELAVFLRSYGNLLFHTNSEVLPSAASE